MNEGKRIKALKAVDPASVDPGYWDRFGATILTRAALQLARRRRVARVSVEAVLSGWSKSLIPLAVAAALVAAFLAGAIDQGKTSPNPETPPVMALEEVLTGQVGEGFYRAVVVGSEEAGTATFMTLVEAAR